MVNEDMRDDNERAGVVLLNIFLSVDSLWNDFTLICVSPVGPTFSNKLFSYVLLSNLYSCSVLIIEALSALAR